MKKIIAIFSTLILLFADSSYAQQLDRQMLCNLMIVQPSGNQYLADGIRVRFNKKYSASIVDDIPKVNNVGENLSSYLENTDLIVEKRPLIQNGQKDTIFLHLYNTSIKTYRFKIWAQDYVQSGLVCYLEDSYYRRNLRRINLSLKDTTLYDFSITNDPLTANPFRFRIVFETPQIVDLISPKVTTKASDGDITLLQNPPTNHSIVLHFSKMEKGTYQVRLVNTIGQIVLARSIDHMGDALHTFDVSNVLKGNYKLQIIRSVSKIKKISVLML